MLITLAGLLAVTGAIAGTYYFATRPVTLRVAVGPSSSDDGKIVQALTHAFAREHGYVRLRQVPTDGTVASAALIADGNADLAIIRGDQDVPKNAEAVATLRKNVAVLWVPSAAPDITKISQLAGRRIGVIGKTPANVNLLKVILRQYDIDPGKIEILQYAPGEVAEAIRNQRADAFLAAGPVNGKLAADAIAASVRDGGMPVFLPIDSAEAIAQNHPMFEAAEIPAGTFGGSPVRPEEDVKTIGFSHHIVGAAGIVRIHCRRLDTAAIRRSAHRDGGISPVGEVGNSGHR